MRERVNKPRAFLSHSSLDVAFIERIESDLRKCQIESWRDQNEIRDGRRWQQVIFEEGIPTCDVIIGYFTENALTSDMVAKEVDAAQLRQLQDNGIAFLPYISKEEIRGKLRLDIQSLHCRIWNDDNYYEVFPSVVAEIWRSYMERTVALTVLQERNRRLEAELELERLQARFNASPFTPQEESEFQYIYKKLGDPLYVYRSVSVKEIISEQPKLVEVGKCKFQVSFIELLFASIKKGRAGFSSIFLNDFSGKFESAACLTSLPSSLPEGEKSLSKPRFEQNLTSKLLLHGLVKEEKYKVDMGTMSDFYTSSFVFTDKIYRFVSWLDYFNKAGNDFSVELIGFIDKDSYEKRS